MVSASLGRQAYGRMRNLYLAGQAYNMPRVAGSLFAANKASQEQSSAEIVRLALHALVMPRSTFLA